MSLRDKAAGSAKTWSGKVRDLADQGTAVAKNRAESMTSSIGRGIAARSGEDNAYGRVATVLDLSDEQATVRLESFVTAFISAVRQVDAEDLSSDDVINAAVRRQRWIGLASMPAWSVGMYASSLYCEAAILCHVEQLHQLGLTNEQLAAHLLALWKVMPDYEQAEAAIQGTGPSVAAFHKARTQDAASGIGFDKRGEIGKLDAFKFLWRLRKAPGKAMDSAPGSAKLRHVVLPEGRVKAVLEQSEKQLGVSTA